MEDSTEFNKKESTEKNFQDLIRETQKTNKLLRLERIADDKPNPEKFIKEELVNIAIAEGNRRAGKKLLEVESNEEKTDKEAKKDHDENQLKLVEEAEKTTKAIVAMSTETDISKRVELSNKAEDESKARSTQKKTEKNMGMIASAFAFMKKETIAGTKKLGSGFLGLIKKTILGGALLALFAFIQSPEFEKIAKELTGPIATGLAYLWQEVISPIGSFFKGVITGDAPWIQGIKKFLEENTPEIISKNSDMVVGVLRGLVGALAVGVLFAPFRTAGLLVGAGVGLWKLTKLAVGLGAISKLFSTLGTATASLGTTAATATVGISATEAKLNKRRIKAAVRANRSLGKAVISQGGNVVRQFTSSGAVNPTFAPTQRAFNQRMSGAQPAKLPGRFGRFAAVPIIGRLFAATQLYDILTSGQSIEQMIPQVAGIFGGLSAASLGALAGATMGASMTLNPLGGFIGSLLGGAVGYYTGDKLAMGLSQFMLGQPVTVLSDSMNERINSAGGLSAEHVQRNALGFNQASGGPTIANPQSGGPTIGQLPRNNGANGRALRTLSPTGNQGSVVNVNHAPVNTDASTTSTSFFSNSHALITGDPVMEQLRAAQRG